MSAADVNGARGIAKVLLEFVQADFPLVDQFEELGSRELGDGLDLVRCEMVLYILCTGSKGTRRNSSTKLTHCVKQVIITISSREGGSTRPTAYLGIPGLGVEDAR